ncbi:MAG: hypothetical protein GX218_09595 [Clostridiaceae bacterium]|nr:hypothetical protein [Clostridiaceae bacterium]
MKMKKIIVVALTVLFVFAMTSCGLSKGTMSQVPNRSETKKEQKEQPTTPTTEAVPDVGTRKNPAKFGETVHYKGEFLWEPIEFEVTLSNPVQGQAAVDRAMKENSFNEFSEGYEPIIFDVTFTLVKYEPEEDDPFSIDNVFSFDYFNSDFSEIDTTEHSVVLDKTIGGKVFEGGTLSGPVGGVFKKDDKGYIVFLDQIWFQVP